MDPTENCPMAKMCKEMGDKRKFGLLVFLPGVLLVLAGVSILLEPKALVWLSAGASILFGIFLLMFANFVRGFSARFKG